MKRFSRLFAIGAFGLLLTASAFAQISTAQLDGQGHRYQRRRRCRESTVTVTQAETGADAQCRHRR